MGGARNLKLKGGQGPGHQAGSRFVFACGPNVDHLFSRWSPWS